MAKSEADFFAKFAIAPPMLVNLIHPSDYLDIADAFGLSNECALYSMRYYSKWCQLGGSTLYDYQLVELFAEDTEGGGHMLRIRKSA